MNARIDSIAVVTANLPYLDRRALSQAWISALHLASDGAPPRILSRKDAHALGIAKGGAGAGARGASATSWRPQAAHPSAARTGAGRLKPPEDGAALRRSAKLHEPGALAHVARTPVRAAFTLAIDGARVQVVVRRDAGRLHVLALCRPAHVERVRAALAVAIGSLRAGGERVECRIETREGAGA